MTFACAFHGRGIRRPLPFRPRTRTVHRDPRLPYFAKNPPSSTFTIIHASSHPPLDLCASSSTFANRVFASCKLLSRLGATRHPHHKDLLCIVLGCRASATLKTPVATASKRARRLAIVRSLYQAALDPDCTCNLPAAALSRSQSTKQLLGPAPYRTYRPA